jgi:ornithine cyclodeaminase/alanine dehydrogenase-like protein (mu-crystallin family)
MPKTAIFINAGSAGIYEFTVVSRTHVDTVLRVFREPVTSWRIYEVTVVNSMNFVASWKEGESASKTRSLEQALSNMKFIVTL